MLEFIKTNPVTSTIRRNRKEELEQATGALALQNVAQGMEARREQMEMGRGLEEAQRLPVQAPAVTTPSPAISTPSETAQPEPGVEAGEAEVPATGAGALTGFSAEAAPAVQPVAAPGPARNSQVERLEAEIQAASRIRGAGPHVAQLKQRLGTLLESQRKSEDAHVTNAMNLLVKHQWDASEQYAKASGIYEKLAPLYTNPKARYSVERIVEQAQAMKLDDLNATTFLNGVLENITQGMPWEQAIQTGTQAAIAMAKKKPIGAPIESKTGIYERTQGGGTQPIVGPDGKILMPTDRRMFLGTGRGGGGSKQQQYAQWRIQTLTGAGVPEDQARRIVAGGGQSYLGPRDVARMAQNLMKMTDENFNPLYPNINAATQAAQAALGLIQNPGQAAAPPAANPNQNDPLGLRR